MSQGKIIEAPRQGLIYLAIEEAEDTRDKQALKTRTEGLHVKMSIRSVFFVGVVKPSGSGVLL